MSAVFYDSHLFLFIYCIPTNFGMYTNMNTCASALCKRTQKHNQSTRTQIDRTS